MYNIFLRKQFFEDVKFRARKKKPRDKGCDFRRIIGGNSYGSSRIDIAGPRYARDRPIAVLIMRSRKHVVPMQQVTRLEIVSVSSDDKIKL